MAALTDGTVAGTIPASPVVPPPTPGAAPSGTTSTSAPPATPTTSVTTVTSKPAADLVTGKIAPTITNATAAITANNATKTSTALPPDDPSNEFNTATGQPNPKFVAPTLTPDQQAAKDIANTPDSGYKFAYGLDGSKTQIPLTDSAATHGLSDTNPTAAPTTAVQGSAALPSGTVFKQYADGTYGEFDATGKYLGTGTQQQYQTAQDASTALTAYSKALSGSYPLSATQQAVIQGAVDAANQAIAAQETINKNVMGGMSVLLNLRGISGDAVGISTMAQNAEAGAQKIQEIKAKLAGDVATMTEAFNNDNLTNLKAAYDSYNQNAKDLQTNIDNLAAAATAAAAAAQKIKDDQRNYDLDVAKFKQTGDQDAFDNALKTEAEAFDEKYKTFTSGMGGAGANAGGVTTSASLTSSGSPDPASQAAVLAQIAQQYGPMTATAIKGLANYSINPADWKPGSAHGLTRDQAVSLAQMYDPTYSDANFAARASYIKGLASTGQGTVGGAINSANKAINHLTAFVTSMAALPNGGSSKLNAVDNALTLNQGVRQTLGTAKTEGLGVADELAKFFKGTGSTDVASIDDWKSQLSTSASPADVKGLTQGAITLLAGQLDTLSEQYQTTMGKAPTSTLLGTSAMVNLSKLKNEGYTVDIPGVLYTDVTAYTKNDPDASSNLDSARQALIQANDPNNPPTPENILQLAQLQ